MRDILEYLKSNGERLDYEIASGIGKSLANVKEGLSELSRKGDVIMCHSIQFRDGKQIEGMRCRLAGYAPPPAPGRKAKPRPLAN